MSGLSHLDVEHPCSSYGEKYCPKCRIRYWCFTLKENPLPGLSARDSPPTPPPADHSPRRA